MNIVIVEDTPPVRTKTVDAASDSRPEAAWKASRRHPHIEKIYARLRVNPRSHAIYEAVPQRPIER